jgi:hypothetical protein
VQGGNGPKVPWKDAQQGLNRAITARRVPKAGLSPIPCRREAS